MQNKTEAEVNLEMLAKFTNREMYTDKCVKAHEAGMAAIKTLNRIRQFKDEPTSELIRNLNECGQYAEESGDLGLKDLLDEAREMIETLSNKLTDAENFRTKTAYSNEACVKKADVISVIETVQKSGEDVEELLVSTIKDMSPVIPQALWIPISMQTFPKENMDCLVALENGEVVEAHFSTLFHSFLKSGTEIAKAHFSSNNPPVYWMKKPSPPKDLDRGYTYAQIAYDTQETERE